MKSAKNGLTSHQKRLVALAEAAFKEARKDGAPGATEYFKDKCSSESDKRSPDGPAA